MGFHWMPQHMPGLCNHDPLAAANQGKVLTRSRTGPASNQQLRTGRAHVRIDRRLQVPLIELLSACAPMGNH
jgi:hypothetical protein